MMGILLFIVLLINIYNVVNAFSLCNRKISNYRINSYNNFDNGNSDRKSNSVLIVSKLNSRASSNSVPKKNYSPFNKQYPKIENSVVGTTAAASTVFTAIQAGATTANKNYSPFKKQYPKIESSIETERKVRDADQRAKDANAVIEKLKEDNEKLKAQLEEVLQKKDKELETSPQKKQMREDEALFSGHVLPSATQVFYVTGGVHFDK